MKAKRVYFGLTIIWAGLIFYGSSWPATDLPTAPDVTSFLVHFFEYTILGLLLGLYANSGRRRAPGTTVVAAIGWGFLFAVSDEIHQIFVPGRNFEAIDLLVDLIGLTMGLFMAALRAQAANSELVKGRRN
jgi:VanZ family protein